MSYRLVREETVHGKTALVEYEVDVTSKYTGICYCPKGCQKQGLVNVYVYSIGGLFISLYLCEEHAKEKLKDLNIFDESKWNTYIDNVLLSLQNRNH